VSPLPFASTEGSLVGSDQIAPKNPMKTEWLIFHSLGHTSAGQR
jgi:hypothetical protein